MNQTPIYDRMVTEHGDPREAVNECDRVISSGMLPPREAVTS